MLSVSGLWPSASSDAATVTDLSGDMSCDLSCEVLTKQEVSTKTEASSKADFIFKIRHAERPDEGFARHPDYPAPPRE